MILVLFVVSMAKDIEIALDKMFWVGIIKNLWENKTPDFYADEMINLRIKEGGVTPRQWQSTQFDWSSSVAIQGIVGTNWQLHYVQAWDFYTYDIASTTNTDIGAISHTWKVRFITYGIYTIILTGAWYPRVWNGTSLTQLTDSSLPVNTNPSFAATYANFTIINDSIKPNTITVSRVITTTAQERAYARSWDGSETITLKGNVLWFESTLNFLRIFSDKTIEYISKDNVNTTGWLASLFSTAIWVGDELLNTDCTASANDFIFYTTKSNKIKTVNYIQGNIIPQIATISDNIEELLDTRLNADQSKAFMYYNKAESLIVCVFRSLTSSSNDLHIIRDLKNNERITDNKKYYGDVAIIGDDMYASSALSYKIIKDNDTRNDFTDPVTFLYKSWQLILWNPTSTKVFRGVEIAWKYNTKTVLQWIVEVDWKTAMSKEINWLWIGYPLEEWIGSDAIWVDPIWWEIAEYATELEDFSATWWVWAIRIAWQKARIIIKWWETNQYFIVDYAKMTARPRKQKRISNKV